MPTAGFSRRNGLVRELLGSAKARMRLRSLRNLGRRIFKGWRPWLAANHANPYACSVHDLRKRESNKLPAIMHRSSSSGGQLPGAPSIARASLSLFMGSLAGSGNGVSRSQLDQLLPRGGEDKPCAHRCSCGPQDATLTHQGVLCRVSCVVSRAFCRRRAKFPTT